MNNSEQLSKTANQMVAKGKGILAADESTGTWTKRLNSINVDSTVASISGVRETVLEHP